MRKGVGIAGAKARAARAERAAAHGQEVQGEQLAGMKVQMEDFRKNLEEFALKHKKEINDNPVFRKEFLTMCREIGVDPLSCK